MHAVAHAALRKLTSGKEPLVVAIQNVAEFWNVATRPEKNNGLGYTAPRAHAALAGLEGYFEILPETLESYALWRSMLTRHAICGVQVHDARLASVMIAHNVTRMVTFNTADFARFPEIEAVHPSGVL